MLKYIRSLHVQDNNQCELLRARQIANACDQCVKTINISDNASPCLHELQSPSQRFFSDYALMSYFAKNFPDLSNRKKSIKTTLMTGLYRGSGHVLQKAPIEAISFSDNQLGESNCSLGSSIWN